MQKTYDPSHYRVVFFSGSPLGVPFLQHIAQDIRFEVVGVVSMADKASGRWQQTQENIIKETASQLGIKTILTPSKINPDKSDEGKEFAQTLESLKADYFVIVAYGKIMPMSILNIPSFGSINVHPSLLPTYRWSTPMQTALLNGETETWITIMKMDEKMDEWDILTTYKFKLPFSWTSKELFEKVMHVWPQLLADSMWDSGKWHIHGIPQDHSQATYCHKIEKDDGRIDLRTTPLQEAYNKYRAYAIWPKIWAVWPEKFMKVSGKTLIIEELICDEQLFAEYASKPVVDATGRLNPWIQQLSIKPEGKKAMDWKSFVNGYLVS
jgi:methionyl-tRNA formyltransferase